MRENDGGWRHTLRLVLNIAFPVFGWILAFVLVPKLLRFFMPFVIGWIIALLANPLVRLLERRMRLVRRHSSIVIVVTALILVVGLLYLMITRSVRLIWAFLQDLPQLYGQIEADVLSSIEKARRLTDFLPESLRQSWDLLGSSLGENIGKAVGQIAPPTVEAAGSFARGIPAMLVYAVVTILSAYFFLIDRDQILAFGNRWLPQWARSYAGYLKGEARHLVGSYFMAQFKIMGVVWLVLAAGFFVLGVGYGPLWALLIAVLDFLPVFGTGTALIPWALVKLLGGQYAFAVGLILIYILTQVIRQVVQPKLVGDSMGLNPLMTLFLLYLGFKLKGIAGMILAVPLGLFFLNLYHYGAFRGITDSLRMLAEDLERFRRG